VLNELSPIFNWLYNLFLPKHIPKCKHLLMEVTSVQPYIPVRPLHYHLVHC